MSLEIIKEEKLRDQKSPEAISEKILKEFINFEDKTKTKDEEVWFL